MGYTKDTSTGKEEGEEKQERITNCTFPRIDQILYHLLEGNKLKIFHGNEILPQYEIIQNWLNIFSEISGKKFGSFCTSLLGKFLRITVLILSH